MSQKYFCSIFFYEPTELYILLSETEEEDEKEIKTFELHHCNKISDGQYNNVYLSKKKYLIYEKTIDIKEIQTRIQIKSKLQKNYDCIKQSKIFRLNRYDFEDDEEESGNKIEDSLVDNQISIKLNQYFENLVVKNFYGDKIFYSNNLKEEYCCYILEYKEWNVQDIVDKLLKNRVDKKKQNEKSILLLNENIEMKEKQKMKKIKRLQNLNEQIDKEIVYIFNLIIKKIILLLSQVKLLNFFHGDLKLNNIICNKGKYLEDLNFLLIDFGNSHLEIKKDEILETFLFRTHIGTNQKENYFYCDISFLIIWTYRIFSVHENIEQILLPTMQNLYQNPLTAKELKVACQENPWTLYLNNLHLGLLRNYHTNRKIHDFKFSLNSNFEEIITNNVTHYKLQIKNKKIKV